VLITGGSRGLGYRLAHAFLRRGAAVTLLARDVDGLVRARAFLEEAHPGAIVHTIRADVTHAESLRSSVTVAAELMGGLDVFVHNAGLISVGPLDTATRDDFALALDTHFWAALDGVRAALPYLGASGRGRVVLVSSFGGRVAVPHMAPYVASKFALSGLGEALGFELAARRIAVTNVYPSVLRTGSHRHARFKGRYWQEYAWFAAGAATPLFSMAAERAAERIVRACEERRRSLVLGWPARFAVGAQALFPNLYARAMDAVARRLPAPGGIGAASRPGYASRSRAMPRALTWLAERAAERNLEWEPHRPPDDDETRAALRPLR
jgi:short-subunit dehydrogenase